MKEEKTTKATVPLTEKQRCFISCVTSLVTLLFWGTMLIFIFYPLHRECVEYRNKLDQITEQLRKERKASYIFENKSIKGKEKSGH